MSTTVTVLLACILASVPLVNGFYLFFPQANDRILALEVADQAADIPNFSPDVIIDPEEAVMAAKRTSERGGQVRRRSADGYRCPCLHKVCTYHCMTK